MSIIKYMLILLVILLGCSNIDEEYNKVLKRQEQSCRKLCSSHNLKYVSSGINPTYCKCLVDSETRVVCMSGRGCLECHND